MIVEGRMFSRMPRYSYLGRYVFFIYKIIQESRTKVRGSKTIRDRPSRNHKLCELATVRGSKTIRDRPSLDHKLWQLATVPVLTIYYANYEGSEDDQIPEVYRGVLSLA